MATCVETPCGNAGLVWHLWGQGSAAHPPVVLLHGGSGSWTHWLRNIQPLVDGGRRVLAADLAMQLHVANVLRDRMKGRSLAYTDALVRALAQVLCPVDAIYVREDALYRGRLDVLATALRAAPNFNGLRLIEDAGHWVQFERPQAFNSALLAMLNDGPHPAPFACR